MCRVERNSYFRKLVFFYKFLFYHFEVWDETTFRTSASLLLMHASFLSELFMDRSWFRTAGLIGMKLVPWFYRCPSPNHHKAQVELKAFKEWDASTKQCFQLQKQLQTETILARSHVMPFNRTEMCDWKISDVMFRSAGSNKVLFFFFFPVKWNHWTQNNLFLFLFCCLPTLEDFSLTKAFLEQTSFTCCNLQILENWKDWKAATLSHLCLKLHPAWHKAWRRHRPPHHSNISL